MHKNADRFFALKKQHNWSAVIFISTLTLCITGISVFHILIGIYNTPQGMSYMATGHYYLDYFYYLVAIAQGTFGKLIPEQFFSLGQAPKYPHLWPYTLAGIFGGIFQLSPIAIYWLFIIVLVFCIILTTYICISKALPEFTIFQKAVGLIIVLFAAPFYLPANNSIFMVHFADFWSSKNIFFKRFEPIPHHLLSTLVTLILSYFFVDTLTKVHQMKKQTFIKRIAMIAFLGAVLVSIYPFIALVFSVSIVSYGALLLFFKIVQKKIISISAFRFSLLFIVYVLAVCVTGFAIKTYYDQTAFSASFQAFETQSHQSIPPWFYLLCIGPTVIFWPAGLFYLIKKYSPLAGFFIVYALSSSLLFFSSLDISLGTHNARFLSPVNYMGYGILAVAGIYQMSGIFKKLHKQIFYLLATLLIIVSLPPTLSHAFQMAHDRNIFSPITYLPKNTMEGFAYLKNAPDGAVLTTPAEFIGQLLPAFTGKKVYIARQIATPNYDEKAYRSDAFFRGDMSAKEAEHFLRSEQIRYIVLTSIEKYVQEPFAFYDFLNGKYKHYSVINQIYKNPGIVIFEVSPKKR